ncbi:hypothetical protein F5Y08DRAFT_339029 [Xylaria arbuscula]|nr:hypothetical protein F5Y08DRAFT_339029 [Xylaria arbuscula]
MDEDIFKPTVSFHMTGVVPYDRSPPRPPETRSESLLRSFIHTLMNFRLFQVNGLGGELPVLSKLFEDSPYSDCSSIHSWRILGGDIDSVKTLEVAARNLLMAVSADLFGVDSQVSCAFLAEDLGGSIIKLALVIASEEAEYQKILHATQTVIFFGTPHRGSSEYSLDAAVHSVVVDCFQEIPGDWFPETLNSLSRYLEHIDQRFRRIAHMFNIISYYQKQPISSLKPYKVIVPKECATLGLETETMIGVSRAYSDMRIFMNRNEAHVARVLMKNSNIRHWDEFRYCMDILEPAELNLEYDGQMQLSLKYPTQPSHLYRNNPEFLAWISQEPVPRYLSLTLKNSADSAGLLSAVAKAIREIPDALWIACPLMTSSGPRGPPFGKSHILASLIHQVLEQQPRVFLYIQHLLPNLVDATRSNMQTWRERCLWLCLRTLIHSPIGVALYGFLHVETKESIEVLHQINSAVNATESRFRLVLAFAPGLTLGISSTDFLHMDLYSKHDPSANDYNTIERLDFFALTWIAFATRPLSLDELEVAAALIQAQESSLKNNHSEKRPSGYAQSPGVRLRDFLPDIIEIDSNRVFLCLPYWQVRDLLSRSKPPCHDVGEDWSPHLYLAEKCLGLVKAIEASPYDQLAAGFTVSKYGRSRATRSWAT